MNNARDQTLKALEGVMLTLQKRLRDEVEAQGHRLTGRLIQFQIKKTDSAIIGSMYFADYGVFIELGVPADRIPYSPSGPRRGGTSKYIQALISYFQLRGLSTREANRAAFATATKHSREGMPTRASYRFSRTGQRTGFVQKVIDTNMKEVGAILEREVGKVLRLQYADFFKQEGFKVTV